jgi:signal transduction histidine kinase
LNVAAQGGGFVEYTYLNPISQKVEEKISYAERIDDIIFSGGAYK